MDPFKGAYTVRDRHFRRAVSTVCAVWRLEIKNRFRQNFQALRRFRLLELQLLLLPPPPVLHPIPCTKAHTQPEISQELCVFPLKNGHGAFRT